MLGRIGIILLLIASYFLCHRRSRLRIVVCFGCTGEKANDQGGRAATAGQYPGETCSRQARTGCGTAEAIALAMAEVSFEKIGKSQWETESEEFSVRLRGFPKAIHAIIGIHQLGSRGILESKPPQSLQRIRPIS